MQKHLSLALAVAMIGLSGHAHSAAPDSEAKTSVEYKDNGGYEATSNQEKTDASGTTKMVKDNVDVDIDSKGMMKKTIKSEKAVDPAGMMNKNNDNSKTVFEQKKNGGYKQTTTQKHSDGNGTDNIFITTTDVDVDDAGNVTTVAKTEKSVDPAGLMNKKTVTSTSKSVNGKIVSEDKR